MAAEDAGSGKYDPGEPCPNKGHVSLFYVNGGCVTCSLMRRWLQRHPGMSEDDWKTSRAKEQRKGEARKKPENADKAFMVGFVAKPRTQKEAADEKSENKLPMIGGDDDVNVTTRRLIKANAKFLKLLITEKLAHIRECPDA
jgi:hypothetical protein